MRWRNKQIKLNQTFSKVITINKTAFRPWIECCLVWLLFRLVTWICWKSFWCENISFFSLYLLLLMKNLLVVEIWPGWLGVTCSTFVSFREGYLCILIFASKYSISFKFYIFIWNKCSKSLMRSIFMGVNTVQLLPKQVWVWHWHYNQFFERSNELI